MSNLSIAGISRRQRAVTVGLAGAALVLGLAGCGESTRPTPPPEVIGDFDLVAVDGQPLPREVALTGRQCALTQGTLRLRAGRKWDWFWSCVEQPGAGPTEYGAGDWYTQPAADTLVFPTNAPTVPTYWGAGRVRGDLLEIATLYPSTSIWPGGVPTIFGEHRWNFRRR